jgi:hypothetical protein
MLQGAHSATYRATVHDEAQMMQHDVRGARLSDRLRDAGLGNSYVWEMLGLIPALLALWRSLMVAMRINRNPRSAAPAS